MASHPEQLRVQIEDSIESSIPYDDPKLVDLDIELLEVIQGKGSSHFIVIIYVNKKVDSSFLDYFNNQIKPEIMDAIASSTSRRRLPNLSFKFTNYLPNQLPNFDG